MESDTGVGNSTSTSTATSTSGLASLLPQEAKNILRMLASLPNTTNTTINATTSGDGNGRNNDRWGFATAAAASTATATGGSRGSRFLTSDIDLMAIEEDSTSDVMLFDIEDSDDNDDESSYALSVELQDERGANSNGASGSGSNNNNGRRAGPAVVSSSLEASMLQALGDEEEEEEEEGDTVAARALLNRIRGATGTSSGASSSGNNSKAGGSSSGADGARGRGAGSRPTVASSAATATGIDDDASQQMQTQAQTQQLPVLMLQPDYRVEIVRLRSELNAQKDAFKDLEITPAMYDTLRLRPEFELSLLEYVRMRAASIYLPLKAEAAGLREHADKLASNLQQSNAHVATLTNDMDICRRLCDSNVEAFKLDAAAAVSRAQRLSERVSELEALCGESHSKAARCDKAEAEAEQLRSELRMLRERWTEQGAVLVQLGDAERSLRSELQSITSSHSLVSQDKDFQSREVLELRRQLDDASRQADTDRERALSAELKNRELSEQLLTVRLRAQTDADERVRSEVAKLREEAAIHLAEVRATSQSVIDREHNVLTQRAAQLESEVTYLRQQLTAATRAAEEASKQLHIQQTAYTADTSALRSELKLSAYSVSAITANYEERGVQIQKLAADLDRSREECNALRSAMFELESEQAHGRGSLLAELESLRQRVAVYESLEAGVDQAVQVVARAQAEAALSAAATSNGGARPSATNTTTSTSSGGYSKEALEQLRSDVFAEFKGLSIDPHRRLQQAIDAVSKCMSMEKERADLQSRISTLEAENAALTEQLKLAKAAFDNSLQPASYLAQRLKEKDESVLKLEKELVHKSSRMDGLATQLSRSKAECDDLRERLSLLLRQRAEVESLRSLLLQMQTQAEEGRRGKRLSGGATTTTTDNGSSTSIGSDSSYDSDDSESSDYDRSRRRRHRSRGSSRNRSTSSRDRSSRGDINTTSSNTNATSGNNMPRFASPTASSAARTAGDINIAATPMITSNNNTHTGTSITSTSSRSPMMAQASPRFNKPGSPNATFLSNTSTSNNNNNTSTSASATRNAGSILLSPTKASPKWHKREILPPSPSSNTSNNTNTATYTNTSTGIATSPSAGAAVVSPMAVNRSNVPAATAITTATATNNISTNTTTISKAASASLRISTDAVSFNSNDDDGNQGEEEEEEYSSDDGFAMDDNDVNNAVALR